MPDARPALVPAILICLAGGGCAAQGPTLDDAIHRYDRGLYSTSQRMAQTLASTSRGIERDRATWVAGMSAMRQDDQWPAARRFLEQTAASSDPDLRARAQAMIGELDRREGEYRSAVRHFERAWPGLDEANRRDAAAAAISALRAAGDVQGVEAWEHRLEGSDEPPTTAAWTLQAGAFRSRSGADSHRRSMQRQTRGTEIGDARIHNCVRDGRQLWLVHIGAFETRSEAERARRTVPQTDLLIVRVP